MNRFPVRDNDYTNAGFLFKEIASRTLEQEGKPTPLYLFRLTKNQVITHGGKYHCNPKRPMGENTISELFSKLCKLAGVKGRKTPHMMRAYVATRLANDPTVSSAEVQAALRHNSIVSQKAYIVPTVSSEVARARSLGAKADFDHEEDSKPAATDKKPAAKDTKKKKKKKKSNKRAPTEDPPQKKLPPTMPPSSNAFAMDPSSVIAAQQAAFAPGFGAGMMPMAPFGGGMMPFAPFGGGWNPMMAYQQQAAAAAAAAYAASMAAPPLQPSATADTSDESSDEE